MIDLPYHRARLPAVLCLASLAAACGGGGGSPTAPSPTDPGGRGRISLFDRPATVVGTKGDQGVRWVHRGAMVINHIGQVLTVDGDDDTLASGTAPGFDDGRGALRYFTAIRFYDRRDALIVNLSTTPGPPDDDVDLPPTSEASYHLAFRGRGVIMDFGIGDDPDGAEPYEIPLRGADRMPLVEAVEIGSGLDILLYDITVASRLPGWSLDTVSYRP